MSGNTLLVDATPTAGDDDTVSMLNRLADAINQRHGLVCQAMQLGLEQAQQAGTLLFAAKTRVGHGGWLSWLAANCTVSARQAQAYMKLAIEWPGFVEANAKRGAHLKDLPMRKALAMLAAAKATWKGEYPSADPNLPPDYRCPHCGFRWIGNPTPPRNAGDDAVREPGMTHG